MCAKVGEAETILGPKTKELRFHSTRCDRVPVFDIQKNEPLQASVIIASPGSSQPPLGTCHVAPQSHVTLKKKMLRFDLI